MSTDSDGECRQHRSNSVGARLSFRGLHALLRDGISWQWVSFIILHIIFKEVLCWMANYVACSIIIYYVLLFAWLMLHMFLLAHRSYIVCLIVVFRFDVLTFPLFSCVFKAMMWHENNYEYFRLYFMEW